MNSSASPSAPRLRSCAICRRRKVRCDKQTPCSNCRLAGMECVVPSSERAPRWARRMQRVHGDLAAPTGTAPAEQSYAQLQNKMRHLEDLIKDLSGQLEQTRNSVSVTTSEPSPLPATSTRDQHGAENGSSANMQQQFGRLVVQGTAQPSSRYISSGFWSRVDDELHDLDNDRQGLAETESTTSSEVTSPAQSSSLQELDRTPAERHAFLFGHNLNPNPSDIPNFHPVPSQVSFLLETFAENVNCILQIVHMPSIMKLARSLRAPVSTQISPADESLLFAIYYAAIASMEEEDIKLNFNCSKSEISMKFRLGLEYALAKSDMFNAPNVTVIQSLAIFLCVVRRHDSPRYVWMMTGVLIRMAQYLGLQRDGTQFKQLTPFQIETRRRIWWVVCHLDLRASEDQGTELAIPSGSFDTALPSKLNETDLSPSQTTTPLERTGVTDSSFARICAASAELTQRLLTPTTKPPSIAAQDALLSQIYTLYETQYLQHTSPTSDVVHRLAITIARLVMSKLRLFIYLPVLFTPPSSSTTTSIRTKLLVAAIEVAEYNHLISGQQSWRHLHWICQTYTHWHAAVLLLLECARQPWSPMLERAWLALHSKWLMPAPQSPQYRNSRVWLPLRRLMATARAHRAKELARLRSDPGAAQALLQQDEQVPVPLSSGPFLDGEEVDFVAFFRDRWREAVENAAPVVSRDEMAGIEKDREWLSGVGAGYGYGAWFWADAEPGVDVFADVEMGGMQINGEDVDWYAWIEQARGME